jgi:serine/threonine protein kinase
LLTGSVPFAGPDPADIIVQQLEEPPPDIGGGSDGADDLVDVLHRCLNKAPLHRPSAADVEQSLR